MLILLLFEAEVALVVVSRVPLPEVVRRHVLHCLIASLTLVCLTYLIWTVSSSDINLLNSLN